MKKDIAISGVFDDYKYAQKYRRDIDGLRAVAVLSVIGFHAFPMRFHGGFIGVDIFFVISGFLISTIIFDSLQRDSFNFIEFYSRRIRRIFPSLIVVLISCLIFGWFVLLSDEYKQLGKHAMAGAIFLSNVMLWKESGYFDSAADTKPLLHLWSLGIEEQFYIIWPLLLWAAWKNKFNWLTISIIIGIISFALNIRGVRTDTIATFYLPQTRFWELLIGSTLAYLTLYNKDVLKKIKYKIDFWMHTVIYEKISEARDNTLSNVMSILGATLLVAGMLFITKEKHFPGKWALFPVLGSALIIASGSQAWLNRKILSNRILVWFGLISFPLYLWHWPVLVFARIVGGDVILSRSARIIAILISIILAWCTSRLIEKPLRFGVFKKFKTIILLLLIVILGYVGHCIDKNNGFQGRIVAKKGLDFIWETKKLGYLACQDKRLLKGISLSYCLIPAKGEVNAAIIGDSHADDKFHGIVKNDKTHSWMLIGHSSCPPVYGINVEGEQKNCQNKFENIINWLVTKPEIKTIVLSYFGNYFLTTNYAADHVNANTGPKSIKISSMGVNKLRADIFEQGLNNAIQKLQKANKKIIVFIDIPELPFLPRDCYRNPFLNCNLTKKEVYFRQFELRLMLSKLKIHNPKILIFDPIALFCKNNACTFKDKEKILYRDSHHLSLRGSDAYGNHFVEWMHDFL